MLNNHFIINMVIENTNCDFCGEKQKNQLQYIEKLEKEFANKENKILKLPLALKEIRGKEMLGELAERLFV